MPIWIKTLIAELQLVLKDVFTSSSGDYDPARVFGYIPVVLGGFTFIGLSIYDTVIHQKFDYNGFAVGLSGVAIAIAGAAAGVWLKKGAEQPHATPTNDSVTALATLVAAVNKQAAVATPAATTAPQAATTATPALSVAAQKAAEKAAAGKPQ